MCMVLTIGCSALQIVSCLIGKSSIRKLHKLGITFQYIIMIRMLDCEMETEVVVGWFEVLVRRESGLCNFRNRVDYEAMCGSLCC